MRSLAAAAPTSFPEPELPDEEDDDDDEEEEEEEEFHEAEGGACPRGRSRQVDVLSMTESVPSTAHCSGDGPSGRPSSSSEKRAAMAVRLKREGRENG